MSDSLTPDEIQAVRMAGELMSFISSKIVEEGPSRTGDLEEFVFYIHGIQNSILSNAAARQYPEQFRRLGSVVGG